MSWNDKRPMSPHLQVYKLPQTGLLSILHRMTGAALAMGLILMIIILAALAGGEESWSLIHGLISSWFGYLVLMGFTFALYYHLCNGIRHLIWDTGNHFDLKSVEKTGWAVLIVSSLLTVITWSIAIF